LTVFWRGTAAPAHYQRKCPTQEIIVDAKEKSWQINRLRCVVCDCCVETCLTKYLAMDNPYPAALTARYGEAGDEGIIFFKEFEVGITNFVFLCYHQKESIAI